MISHTFSHNMVGVGQDIIENRELGGREGGNRVD